MGAGKFSLDLSHNTKHKSSFSFFEVLQRDLVGGGVVGAILGAILGFTKYEPFFFFFKFQIFF